MPAASVPSRERAALVGLIAGASRRLAAEQSMDELAGLAEAAGAHVVLHVSQERARPDAATFLGRGKLETCWRPRAPKPGSTWSSSTTSCRRRRCGRSRPSPGCKTIDRTQLILDIFAQRAHARRQAAGGAGPARYLLPRLAGSSTRAVAAGRRHRHTRSRRNQARDRSPPDPRAHPRASARRSTTSGSGARSCASAGRRQACRRSRSSATPTRARRRCSTR